MPNIPQTDLSLRTKLLIWGVASTVTLRLLDTPWENIPIPVAIIMLFGYLTRTKHNADHDDDDADHDDDDDVDIRDMARSLRNRPPTFKRTDHYNLRKGGNRHRFSVKPQQVEKDDE